ncbi:D-lactate dehydrogenase [Herbaspirillum sp. NPDC087042]|uniref:D-lactate dehydrogenase n=1 Tax=Herbaspirillum sp. NPDC087042 TaxID=3364004 RepID=UPI003800D361
MPTCSVPPRHDAALLARLREIVGADKVLTDSGQTRRYRQGFRSGEGEALAVVFPSRLIQQWHILQACIDAGKAVLIQAANTGLTEGSTPHGGADVYGREVVIIHTLAMNGIRLLDQGRQAICFPGATLHALGQALRPYGREPHSETGSSCLGASVIGGICNNSGGMLVRRGPAYTEMALFARVDADGQLRLVNHLGIQLGDTPDVILSRLEQGDFDLADVDVADERRASCADYESHVRDLAAGTPARYNNDPARLFETSGCAGKLAVFAVRVDTFAAEEHTRVFCIGVPDPATLTTLRHRLLAPDVILPVACEYMHRDIFDLSARYARDMFAFIERFGTEAIGPLFDWKSRIDRWLGRFKWMPSRPTDRLAQCISRLLPQHLPARLLALRRRHAHLLLLKTAGDGIAQVERLLAELLPDADRGEWFACTQAEGEKAFLHRFVAGGAAMRFNAVHGAEIEGVLSLDFALPRNAIDWTEQLPEEIMSQLLGHYRYGHFLCHVFHHDYIVRKGADLKAIKQRVLQAIAARGGEYPAEHNVGHVYLAKPALAEFYRSTDPTNSFNPGIGQMSKRRFYE